MVLLCAGKIITLEKIKKLLKMKINPYLTLGISKNSTPAQTKSAFRKKLFEAKDDDELRAKICFAYDIIVNKNFYKECENDM